MRYRLKINVKNLPFFVGRFLFCPEKSYTYRDFRYVLSFHFDVGASGGEIIRYSVNNL